ncbi:AbgT family transporter [Sediminivirga luteola]|uniref:AbgT family transporter n=1 Tax=Sediminivirga luteola TaxID=1774748 RepID=UPI001F588F04|nr:AbgT family transporter [Sediminivirga luteola]MCI2264235.1 AbgT family transporter [Sediminivirga luteola]
MPAHMPTSQRSPRFQRTRVLDLIERIGNKLPEPMIIFLWLIAAILLFSAVLAAMGVSVTHPDTGEDVRVQSLLSGEGVQFILENTVSNFVGFAPVGTVLTMMLGIGLADKTGLLRALVRATLLRTPAWLLPYAVFLVANNAVLALDAAFLIVPPLAAIVYRTLGRNPLVGIISAFAGCSSGYASGIVITALDPMLAGISTEAAAILGTDLVVTPADNYYVFLVSMVGCVLVGGTITRWVIEPRLGPYEGDHQASAEPLTVLEKRGLIASGTVAALYLGGIAAAALVPGSPLQNEDGGLIPSPLLGGIVPVLFIFFALVGLAYGIFAKEIRSGRDVVDRFAEAIGSMKFFLVVIFFIAQFSAYFSWTNIGLWISVNGADFLLSIDATGFGVLFGVIVVSALLTLLITSGSGLWAILAPIFVPMLMQVGFHPAAIQMAYRIGDGSTSMITPLMPYMIVILGFMREWDKDKKLGHLISNTLPYAIAVFVTQTLVFLGFYYLDIPLGPGIGFHLE